MQKRQQLLDSNFTEEEYEKIESIFTNNSTHVESIIAFIKNNILPNLILKDCFLDIGPGPGYITNQISPYFLTTTVVEPCVKYNAAYQTQHIWHQANFQNINLQHQYDFVLCSHVLYHVDQKEWESFIKEIYKAIRPGGKGLIVFISAEGPRHDLFLTINSNYPSSQHIRDVLNNLNINYSVYSIIDSFFTRNFKDFEQLITIFTIDDCFPQAKFQFLSDSTKEQIYQKINLFIEQCKTSDETYRLIYKDDYFLLSK